METQDPVASFTFPDKAAFATNDLLCTGRPLLWYYTRQCMEDDPKLPGRKADNGSHKRRHSPVLNASAWSLTAG